MIKKIKKKNGFGFIFNFLFRPHFGAMEIKEDGQAYFNISFKPRYWFVMIFYTPVVIFKSLKVSYDNNK